MSYAIKLQVANCSTSYKIVLTVNLKMCIYSEFEILNNYKVKSIFAYHLVC